MSHLDQSGVDVRRQTRCRPAKPLSAVVRACTLGDKPRADNTKRICKQQKCGTILSIYNPGKYCSCCIQRMERLDE